MKPPLDSAGPPVMSSLFVFTVAALLFGSPLRRLWLREGGAWYLPFLVWLAIIALGVWAARRRGRP